MYFQCIVRPNSKMSSISVNSDGSLRIKITAPPVDGKANEYLIKYMAKVFDLPKSHIQIISGFTSTHKRINIVADEVLIKKVLNKL